MSRLEIASPKRAKIVMEGLYKDLERRIESSPPGLCPVDMARAFLELCHAQTCGKCVPCRIGLGQLNNFIREVLDGKATMKVKNEHLKMWNVDAKEMFQQARANTQPVNTPILQSMDEMLLSIFNEEGHATNLLDENVDFGFRSHDMLYALTNVEKQYGASMITQPEVLNKLEQLFPEGFYVLPSSVHEVLIVPYNGEMEPKMLGEMVREVNKNEVERQEVLSDRVYSYDKEKHQIRQEPDSIQKVKEMER